MDILCSCGSNFKPHKMGELVLKNGYLYSCDSWKCPKCSKIIIGGIAKMPLCEANSDEATRTIDSMLERGYMTYGAIAEGGE